MLVVGLVLIVVAIALLIWGAVSIASGFYNAPFAPPEEVEEVCKAHVKPLGTSPGTKCGVLIRDLSGKATACRKGAVNSIGNECTADANHTGPGLIVASVLILLAGIVFCFVKEKREPHKSRKHK